MNFMLTECYQHEIYLDHFWDSGNNQNTEAWEYLKSYPKFDIDKQFGFNLLLSESQGEHEGKSPMISFKKKTLKNMELES